MLHSLQLPQTSDARIGNKDMVFIPAFKIFNILRELESAPGGT